LERATYSGGQEFAGNFFNLVCCLTQRELGLEVEADRNGGYLAEVGYGQRADGWTELSNAFQWDQFALSVTKVK
jgi:hypothetical protein